MKKKLFAAILIYIALTVLCIAVIYVVPSVRGLLEKTYVTEWGTISISDNVSGYIVRDEQVYVAAEDFKIKQLAKHNILIKAGTRVLDVNPAHQEAEPEEQADAEAAAAEEEAEDESTGKIHRKYRSLLEDIGKHTTETRKGKTGHAGYVSYWIDGAEGKLRTNRLADLSEKDLKELTDRKKVDTPTARANKGEPVFKITENRKWYLVFYMNNDDAEKYYAGRTVTISVDGKDASVRVASVEPGDKKTRIALSCKLFYDGFLEQRRLDTTVTVASAEGLILKDSSLVTKGDQIGVLVKNKLGEHKFKPISIKADDGEQCVAYSDIYVDEGGNFVETIGTYDEIVEEPSPEEVEKLNEKESEKS